MQSRTFVCVCALLTSLTQACGGDSSTDDPGSPGGAAGQSTGGKAGSSGAGTAGAAGSVGGASGQGGSSGSSGQSGAAGATAGSAGAAGSSGANGGTAGASAGTAGAAGATAGSAGANAGGTSAGGANAGGTSAGGTSAGASGTGGTSACDPACEPGNECLNGICIPELPSCTVDIPCKFDTHCVDEKCVPYNDGENNPACLFVPTPEVLAPEVKCEFLAPPVGDMFPKHINVEATAMVANLGYGAPSIVAPFQGFDATNGVSCPYEDCYYRFGVIRLLSGVDCKQQAVLGGQDLDGNGTPEWARSASPVALADLDGDKIPEIIANMVEQYNPATQTGNETIIAFTNKGAGWVPLWPKVHASNGDGTPFNATIPVSGASGANWAGPSVHDLDDDGKPEILREGYVFNGQTGALLAGVPAGYASYSTGITPVVANIDGDPAIEMTNGAYVWEFNTTSKTWQPDAAYANPGGTAAGWAAVADFNPYDGAKTAEIAVVTQKNLSVYTNTHQLFAGVNVTLPSGGGGPPTIADFDGDGLPEVGVATSDYYVVVDPDCQATPRPGGKCESRDQCEHAAGGKCPDLMLWSRTSQDHSSQITGSSVFDFEADGKAEVIYADECFARVYSGSDGRVLFSLYHSSSTWQENPVIADVDGDFRSELVVVSNGNFSKDGCKELLDASGVETHFAGTICEKDADCVSGSCVSGLCRCTTSQQCCTGAASDAECIELGRQCAPPPAGTPGAGNTCRASFPHGSVGIRVYKDSRDRWVGSRPIWNQHAYSVTNVNDDGTIPSSSQWSANWTTSGLNNFRQNSPGQAAAGTIPDLTAKVTDDATCYLNDMGGGATLQVPVCNRGTAPVGNNLHVGFYVGGTKICTGTIVDPIAPGACANAFCTWQDPPTSSNDSVDVRVVPNDDKEKSECDGANNEGLVKAVFCTVKP